MLERYDVDTEHVNGEGYYNQELINEQRKVCAADIAIVTAGLAIICAGACVLALGLI